VGASSVKSARELPMNHPEAMTTMAERLTLKDVKPGMIVAEAVHSGDGATLCAAGAAISESILRRFEALGIRGVVVQTETMTVGDPTEVIRNRFRQVLNDPMMATICDCFVSVELSKHQRPEDAPVQEVTEPVEVIEMPTSRLAGLIPLSRWFARAPRERRKAA
jgi:hypothetical protein